MYLYLLGCLFGLWNWYFVFVKNGPFLMEMVLQNSILMFSLVICILTSGFIFYGIRAVYRDLKRWKQERSYEQRNARPSYSD